MALRDSFTSDLNIFFDLDEHCETVNIDGKELKVIVDTEKEKEITQDYDGYYVDEILFYVKKSDFGEKPAIGKVIYYNDEIKKVKNVSEEEGVFIIVLEEVIA